MDGGPSFLGSGDTPPPSETDLAAAIRSAREVGIPFVFSLGGRAGADVHVAPYFALLDEIAAKDGTALRVAFARGEVDKDYVKMKIRSGSRLRRVVETPRLSEYLSEGEVEDAVRLQAQMGPEPLLECLKLYEQGRVDGVMAGRALDLAVHMAYPLSKGFPLPGCAHMAKVVECGGLVCDPANPRGAVIAELYRDGSFTVRPADPRSRCTVGSVAAHTLYERQNPHLEENPGGALDISTATYEQLDERTVRCAGARWVRRPYTVKVEGVRSLGYETVLFAVVREPQLTARLGEYVRGQIARSKEDVIASGVQDRHRFQVVPHVLTVGNGCATLLVRVVASSAEASSKVASTVRGHLVHGDYPQRKTTAGNLAFPLSKALIPMGEAFVFHVWHLLPLDDPLEPFTLSTIEFPRPSRWAVGH
jgi:hypothetical protein